MNIPGLHPNICRMLTRRGFHDPHDLPIVGLCFVSENGATFSLASALHFCRLLNAQEKSARYRANHRQRVASYARAWRAENRDRSRAIVNKCARARRAVHPVHA
jgi:hypothetical protein